MACTRWCAALAFPGKSLYNRDLVICEAGTSARSRALHSRRTPVSEGSHGAGSVVAPESQQRPMTAGKEQRLRVRPPRDRPYG